MNSFLPLPNFAGPVLLWILLIWSFAWKGLALWKATGKRQLVWFVILLLVNTLGILEIVYLFWLARWEIVDNKKPLAFLNEKIGRRVKTA